MKHSWCARSIFNSVKAILTIKIRNQLLMKIKTRRKNLIPEKNMVFTELFSNNKNKIAKNKLVD